MNRCLLVYLSALLGLSSCKTTGSGLSNAGPIAPIYKGVFTIDDQGKAATLSYELALQADPSVAKLNTKILENKIGPRLSEDTNKVLKEKSRFIYSDGDITFRLSNDRKTVESLNYSGLKATLQSGEESQSSSIDAAVYDSLMSRSPSFTNNDQKSLYMALATIIADRNCEVEVAKVKQQYQSRSVSRISVDGVTAIGGGTVDVYDSKDKKHGLSWDANHFTDMDVKDWLKGLKAHQGFYPQLVAKGLCKLVNNNGAAVSSIDIKIKKEIMEAAPKFTNDDQKTLYEALAIIIADKNCQADYAKVVQQFQSRGLFRPKVSVEGVTNIGGGKIIISTARGNEEISWDANHFTEMSVADWLQGKQNHKGIYSQLTSKGICK